jgi:hypothetical protein
MIWHIFKKDWKLLWPLVLLVALIPVAAASLRLMLGQFSEPRELTMMGQTLFPWLSVLGVILLTVLAVHQDRIPGHTQDWLIRPLCRRDMLLAKLLFVLVAVQGPLFAIVAAQSLWAGFSLAESLGAALAQGATVFCSVSLPALLLASVTRTLTQAVFGTLGLIVLISGLVVLSNLLGQHSAVVARSGLLWMRQGAWDLLAVLATIFVLPPLFARRRLLRARMMIAGAVALVIALDVVPWRPLFAVQQWLSPQPHQAGGVLLAFDPGLGRSKDDLPASAFAGNGGADAILLPLRISGLAEDSMLLLDRAEIRLTGPDGTVLYQGVSWLTLDGAGPIADAQLEVHQTSRGGVSAHQAIFFPPRDFARIKNQSLRLEIDYSLTRFHSRGTQAIAALGGDARLAEAGWCKTRMDPEGDDVELGCLTHAYPTGCLTLLLENPATGQRNPSRQGCDPDYRPWAGSIIPGVMRFRSELPFRDLHGLAHYPVDGAQLDQSRVTLQFFSPDDHFTRHLTIPSIRLSDWETEPRLAALPPAE